MQTSTGVAVQGNGYFRWEIPVSIKFLKDSLMIYITSTKVKSLGHVHLFETPWTVACQAPLSIGFSSQKYWSGLPRPSPGDLPDLGIQPISFVSPAMTDGFFSANWEAPFLIIIKYKNNLII